ncbi:hypothetical protein GGI19_005377 [Coemansia pectinata]|uniref:Uncharacterized protein n=1 Tax=Coemansia pectinata TaxID=1052879 RepID=A0A9W8GQC1_9FUNG|nr:hypothetical protein GGI19_005377 [Coemansia pectinata]
MFSDFAYVCQLRIASIYTCRLVAALVLAVLLAWAYPQLSSPGSRYSQEVDQQLLEPSGRE